jgi:hypothetical protein
MAYFHSPTISTNGLVLCLDAANGESFRGEPTTNVVANPLPTSGWNTDNFGGSTITRSFLTENSVPFMRFSDVTNASDYPRVTDSVFPNSATITGTFSTSFEARGTPGAQIRLRIYENGSTKITNTATLTSDWVRYTFENQSTAFLLNQPYFNPVTTGATYDIRNIQIEAKPYATPFVNGTRGGTVATGGGWVDLSGKSNNGGLVNGLTYNSSNLGSLVFDGVDDYINCGNDTSLNVGFGSLTMSVWYMRFTNAGTNLRTLSKGGGDDNSNGLAFLGADNSMNAIVTDLPNARKSVGVSGLSLNRWYYATAVVDRSNNSLSLYIDGQFRTSRTDLTSTSLSGNAPLYVGANAAGSALWSGRISNVQVYNRALSAAEVLQNYNATKGRYGL